MQGISPQGQMTLTQVGSFGHKAQLTCLAKPAATARGLEVSVSHSGPPQAVVAQNSTLNRKVSGGAVEPLCLIKHSNKKHTSNTNMITGGGKNKKNKTKHERLNKN